MHGEKEAYQSWGKFQLALTPSLEPKSQRDGPLFGAIINKGPFDPFQDGSSAFFSRTIETVDGSDLGTAVLGKRLAVLRQASNRGHNDAGHLRDCKREARKARKARRRVRYCTTAHVV